MEEKKDFTVFKLKSKRNFEPDREVQLVSCTTFLCNKPSLIKTPSTKSRFFHHTQEEVMSTFIFLDTCAIQADATPNSKACQFPSFILLTSQHTKYQNQSPECDSCHLQMKHGAVCVSLHHIQSTQQLPKFRCITYRVPSNHQSFVASHTEYPATTKVSLHHIQSTQQPPKFHHQP
jgi:hypothetical protein